MPVQGCTLPFFTTSVSVVWFEETLQTQVELVPYPGILSEAAGSGTRDFYVSLDRCFSNAGPRPGTEPWHQLYRAARDSPGIDN